MMSDEAKQASLADTGMEKYFFRASAADFKKIPGGPIVYWVSRIFLSLYDEPLIQTQFDAKEGIGTRNDEVFMRMAWEVSRSHVSPDRRWILTDKAGDFRKWFMGMTYVMDWEDDGYRIKHYRNDDGSQRSRPQNTQYLFEEGITWGKIGSGLPSFRWRPSGFGFNDAAPTLFGDGVLGLIGQLNSTVTTKALTIRGGTLNITTGVVGELPLFKLEQRSENCKDEIVRRAIDLSSKDWDFYETSWDFAGQPLLQDKYRQVDLKATYQKLRAHWQEMTLEMRHLEEENNCIFIEAYGQQDELTPDVPLKEITLTCNPHYRYGGDKTEEELEALLLADTMREFLSYATGCMFGRYSLDKPGLILANQGDTLTEYLQQVPEPSFMPNQDNVIPILDGDWFTDDITERFRQFLRVTFGEAHYEENLVFIEAALGKDIRKYFLKDFYNDHVRRYKKRPIYWLFSSPKGTFNALIYLHRYRPDTVSVVLQYLRDFRKKLAARLDYLQQVGISPSANQSEKTRAQKEIDAIKKQLLELDDYERDTLYPLATAQIALDLDDGVKVNYLKLGPALKKIVGLDAKGED
ncbi:BREX-1 system adenine-specific DNA-methyltransferase PglX [Acidithiobacillus ferriphilus]|uniref:BREX-1 system adenine-specific DNA-methyltransferase PglX n=1 Tax=Acidithiobacillus ferriphilus TaxID=1689834 RepID=UPI00232EF4C1|nr:BREX-1 system adenine-specific DNA-methyltransferase PglX [Acidithiobacillus ferriphilus]WCE94075.1 BREX-1 system adenine-specific DNA-methyltransferase PglX [Acidithiobacillus ferriphilus]